MGGVEGSVVVVAGGEGGVSYLGGGGVEGVAVGVVSGSEDGIAYPGSGGAEGGVVVVAGSKGGVADL